MTMTDDGDCFLANPTRKVWHRHPASHRPLCSWLQVDAWVTDTAQLHIFFDHLQYRKIAFTALETGAIVRQ